MKFFLTATLVISNIFFLQAQSIFPTPVSMVIDAQSPDFILSNKTTIANNGKPSVQAVILQNLIKTQTGIVVKIGTKETINDNLGYNIIFNRIQGKQPQIKFNRDAYKIVKNKKAYQIYYVTNEALINAFHSLVQLFPVGQGNKALAVKSYSIFDYPKFAYRGMHLDVSRHFFDVPFIKKYLDYLAFHKMNIFHWHLTDDQGWRIEIKKYPSLTEIASKRAETLIGHYRDSPKVYDKTPHGGYYTQAQIKDVVKYALERGINIIPEIDIPGHSMAILAAMPQLSTTPDSVNYFKVARTWGMYNRENNVLAPHEETFEVLDNIFKEVALLFPYDYIHIGGDEASKKWWKDSPWVQEFIVKNNLKNEDGLQSYFIKRVEVSINKLGKTIIGWDEILEGGLAPNAIVMSWRGEKGGIAAAKELHKVIMTPGKPLYFDHYQTKNPKDSLAIHGYNPFKAVYSYNPIPKVLDSLGLGSYVLGAQGNVWTEYMASPAKVEYMIFPRMAALAEVLWASKKTPYTAFKQVIKTNVLPVYDLWKVNYCKEWELWE